MKRFLLTIVSFFLVVTFISAGVTIRYYNKDSKTHEMKVTIAGSSKTVEFGSSRTASVTIQEVHPNVLLKPLVAR
jgi:plastocyanin